MMRQDDIEALLLQEKAFLLLLQPEAWEEIAL
jgi:hypothetical protein